MKLKKMRKEKGLTQKELGEVMGVSKDYIYLLESNKRNPSMSLAKKMANYFNVKIDDIFFGN